MSSRREDRLDGSVAGARDADAEDHWAGLSWVAEESTQAPDARPSRPGEELADLAQAVRELAERAETAQLAEEQAAESEHTRKLQELEAVQELARELQARRARLTLESRRQAIRREEKALVARLVRKRAEVRRAGARRDRIREHGWKITHEFRETLRRIEEEPSAEFPVAEVSERPPAAPVEPSPVPVAPSHVRTPSRRMGLAVVGGGAMAATVAAVAWWGSAAVEETGPPSPRATVPDTAEVSSLPVVPDIAGLPIMEARDRLLDAGLGLARVLPTPGPPGVVVRIEPGPGRPLPSGTAVTLYVGVEPDRFVQELEGP